MRRPTSLGSPPPARVPLHHPSTSPAQPEKSKLKKKMTKHMRAAIQQEIADITADLRRVDSRIAALIWSAPSRPKYSGNLSWGDFCFDRGSAERDAEDEDGVAHRVLTNIRQDLQHRLGELRAAAPKARRAAPEPSPRRAADMFTTAITAPAKAHITSAFADEVRIRSTPAQPRVAICANPACGEPLVDYRPHARVCSNRCRVALHRSKANGRSVYRS